MHLKYPGRRRGSRMLRIPGWMAGLAVFAMMASSGVEAADASPSTTVSMALVDVAQPYVAVELDPEPVVVLSLDAQPLIELIEAVVATLPPPPPPPPVWLCPISTPVRFTDTYGEGRNGGRRHLGVDLTAPVGTPTVAPVSGSVRYSRDANGGLSWHLDGDDGIYYYGTHLSRFGSVTGHVDAGTVIGYVGQSGDASIPHLHLEIHPGGITAPSINPTPVAAKACNNTL
ncbi:MAG: M23 family metallopeptidase [Actinobacteria bacterium]|nr:MAG: M23 family metallopeptidase [Actinomycetota bacterium]